MIAQFMTEVLQMLFAQPAFEKRAGVNAGRSVALKVDKVTGQFAGRRVLVGAAEEVVVAHLHQGRERSIGGQMAADIRVILVGPHHHGERIPARQTFDAPFDLAVPE